jgi:hypothetical protein
MEGLLQYDIVKYNLNKGFAFSKRDEKIDSSPFKPEIIENFKLE